MAGGSIGFPTPLYIGGTFAWFKFKIDGDAIWSGGTFATGIDGTTNGGNVHLWQITGKLTVGANAKIVVANAAAGQQVLGTWQVITCDTTADATLPTTDPVWTATAATNNKGFKVTK